MKTFTLETRDPNCGLVASVEVEAIERPLWWQKRGLSYTASGYGRKIPTRYMVKVGSKLRRVYCCIYSNAETCYIGNFDSSRGNITFVRD